MAANLLADLDTFYNSSGAPGVSAQKIESSLALPQSDFSTISQAHAVSSQPQQQDFDLLGDFSASRSTAPHPTSIADSEEDDFGEFESAGAAKSVVTKQDVSGKQRATPVTRKSRDENVLFDVEDEEDSGIDDFGEFEGVDASHVTPTLPRGPKGAIVETKPQPSLIDFNTPMNVATTKPTPNEPKQLHTTRSPRRDERSFGQQRPDSSRRISPKLQPSTTITTKSVQALVPTNEPAWDDFETVSPALHSSSSIRAKVTKAPRASSNNVPSLTETNLPFQAGLPFRLQPLLAESIPPSPQVNIPPPAILLSVFPRITEETRSRFFEPISQVADDADTLSMAYAHPQVRSYLQSLVVLSVILCRIIAGRKPRWRRDKILSQSMSISQASAGGRSGGMKLAGLDKAENAREERDVADAVRAWRSILGRMRSAINSAGKVGVVPEIKEDYLVKMATEKEGAVQALKQCVLCGLKRNERIAKVDAEVEDSFGEWWVDHWGHRDCARFWKTYEKSLKGK